MEVMTGSICRSDGLYKKCTKNFCKKSLGKLHLERPRKRNNKE
jgi:hypothetical protein